MKRQFLKRSLGRGTWNPLKTRPPLMATPGAERVLRRLPRIMAPFDLPYVALATEFHDCSAREEQNAWNEEPPSLALSFAPPRPIDRGATCLVHPISSKNKMTAVKYEQSVDVQEFQGCKELKEPTVVIDDGMNAIDEDDELDSNAYKIKKKISPFVMSFGFRLFGVVLIFVDIIIVVVSLMVGNKPLERTLGVISLAIALFFVIDVLLRVYVTGFRKYFYSMLNTLDCIIVVGTLLINMMYTFSDLSGLSQIPRIVNLFRVLRIIFLIRIFRLASEKERLEKVTRKMVSENKRRYVKDGFDLDLTYITARVIAMSFPSSGQQSFYRNPISEVARFLDTKHEGHYKVYNLCSEKGYDPVLFHYRVERIFIDDHNVPTLEDMLKFTASVRDWMQQDSRNIIAIHCKGGKGRTGTMVCTWLVDSDQFESAKESLAYFGERRTDTSESSKYQGVETPSQSRYVQYYEIVKNKYGRTLPPARSLRIKSVKIYAICGVGKGNGSDLKMQIFMGKKIVFHCVCGTQENCKLFLDGERDCVVISLEGCPVLSNDVKIRVHSPDIPQGYDDSAFFFWFNTIFVEDNRLFLARKELDNPHKPKTWKIFRETFAVELNFIEP